MKRQEEILTVLLIYSASRARTKVMKSVAKIAMNTSVDAIAIPTYLSQAMKSIKSARFSIWRLTNSIKIFGIKISGFETQLIKHENIRIIKSIKDKIIKSLGLGYN